MLYLKHECLIPDWQLDDYLDPSSEKQYISERLYAIDRTYGKQSYGLERGEAVERLVGEVLSHFYGVRTAPYAQEFPGSSKSYIKAYQRDLRLVGGISGLHFPVEVKERNGGGQNIFKRYDSIAVGKQENWLLKNNNVLTKKGYKETLAVIILDTYSLEMRVAFANLPDQKDWKVERLAGELSCTVRTDDMFSLSYFSDFVKDA